MNKPTYTRNNAEKELNEIGCMKDELKCNGGRIPMCMINCYGTWLRKHDHTSFNVFYSEKKLEVTGSY